MIANPLKMSNKWKNFIKILRQFDAWLFSQPISDQWNSTFLEFSFIIEGTSEKVYKILHTYFITLSVTSSFNLSFKQWLNSS